MTRVKANIIANFLGQGWIYGVQLLLVPIYIRLLGIEAYGLIGFFVMLSATMQVFDFGLAQTTSREVARWSADSGAAASPRTTLRTLEPFYLCIGIVVGAAIVLLSPLIANHLIKAEALSREVVADTLELMAAVITLQWMQSLYLSAIAGLQRQIVVNAYRAIYATVGGLGGVLTLILVSPHVEDLFRWYVAASVLGVLGAALLVRATLPRDAQDRGFRAKVLQRVWRFAVGSSLINVTGLALGQADKWILIAIVSLETFGYYAIAASLANALYGVVGPAMGALFPRFNALVAKADEVNLRSVYHAASQVASALVFPIAFTLSLFSYEVLSLWTRNEMVADRSSSIATVLVLGTCLNCVMFVPYNLQLAFGWTRLGLSITVTFLVTLVPASVVLATRYGPIGVASVWLVLNVLYFAVGPYLTHRRVLRGAAPVWYLRDVFPPMLAALAIVGIARISLPEGASGSGLLAFLALALLAALAASVLSGSMLRAWIGQHVAALRARLPPPST